MQEIFVWNGSMCFKKVFTFILKLNNATNFLYNSNCIFLSVIQKTEVIFMLLFENL